MWISVPGVIFLLTHLFVHNFFHLGCPGKISSSQTWKMQRNKQHVRVTDLHIVIKNLCVLLAWLLLGRREILSGFRSHSSWENAFKKKKDTGEFIVRLSE